MFISIFDIEVMDIYHETGRLEITKYQYFMKLYVQHCIVDGMLYTILHDIYIYACNHINVYACEIKIISYNSRRKINVYNFKFLH